jgi:hypothetical protein
MHGGLGAKAADDSEHSKITGCSSICIYEWALVKGNASTLAELRQQKMDDMANTSDSQQAGAGDSY